MTVTIAEAAAELAERLDIPLPEGESSPEFRLSFARTLRIEHLKSVLLHNVADGVLRIRVSDGGYLPVGAEATESSQVDIAEAQAALEANGELFVERADSSGHSEAPEQAVTTATSAQTSKGITKEQVKNAFEGLHFDRDHWGKNLASPPKWLVECRISKGNKKTSALWNPVLIAAALFDKNIALKKLDAVFVGLSDFSLEWSSKSGDFR